MGWAVEHTPEVVARFSPLVPRAVPHGRAGVLGAVPADVGLDIVRVMVVDVHVNGEHSYADVDEKIEKSLAPLRIESAEQTMTEADRLQRNIVAMASYRKGGAA